MIVIDFIVGLIALIFNIPFVIIACVALLFLELSMFFMELIAKVFRINGIIERIK